MGSKFKGIATLGLCVFLFNTAWAEDFSALTKALSRVIPGEKPTKIQKAPVEGLYEVLIGGEVLYGTKDGKYLIQGNLYDMDKGENLTEARRAGVRAKVLAELEASELITFAAEKPKHVITVFTDIDCGYCRKLHQQMEAYNEKGISVRYAAYPRAGLGSKSYRKAVTVWCSDDRKAAITKAKAGAQLDQKKCDNPVARQYKMGGRLGISGTPAIFLEDGTLLPGYIPPTRLAVMLESRVAKK